MRKPLLTIIALLTVVSLFAQDKTPYTEKAAQLQKEIWGNSVPEFKTTTVPADMSKEGAVVLARSFSLQRTTGNKLKLLGLASTVKNVKLTTFHERVKINDKSALEAYSTLEYQKKLDKTVSLLITKFKEVNDTYVGAKIIKPDGKEVVVNSSEEVLLKNETKDQKGKLAISDLQIGDILDYYVSTMAISEKGLENGFTDNDNLILLADEYPVLYYSLDFQFNKKLIVKYIYANGAPHFTESTNSAGDMLLSLKIHNMAKYHGQVWTSPYRQYPYIEIGSGFYTVGAGQSVFDRETNTKQSRFESNKTAFEDYYFSESPGFDVAEKKTKDFFKSSKAFKAAPLDSVLKVLYNQWKFNVFCNYDGKELEDVGSMNYRSVKSMNAASDMCMMLTDMKIDHYVLLVASRNGNSLDNAYNIEDMSAMIQINNGAQPMYMCFDDVFTLFNEIPARFQGEKALALKPKRRNSQSFNFTDVGEITLPVTAANKNQVEEQLQVSLVPGNVQKLKVVRTVKQAGEMRRDDQHSLVPVMDVDAGYKNLANGDELEKRLSKSHETKKMAADFNFAFNKEKAEMKKNFTSEIKSQFDQEPEQVENFKIENAALDNSSPVLQYTSSFVLTGLVKKAGSNYIIDAGKLVGSFYKLEEKDRKRAVDVYMPCARSFNYTISIAIPPGFTAKGMEEMTRRKENKTGSFSSTATVNGNTLTITVKRVYANNFEKVANWPMLTELVDMASDFNTQKILFEKKG